MYNSLSREDAGILSQLRTGTYLKLHMSCHDNGWKANEETNHSDDKNSNGDEKQNSDEIAIWRFSFQLW
jgi:hypothetical protein